MHERMCIYVCLKGQYPLSLPGKSVFTDRATVRGIFTRRLMRGGACVGVLGNTNHILISDDFFNFHSL